MSHRLYFAHPSSSYDSDAEQRAMQLLEARFSTKHQIVNPNKACYRHKVHAIRRANQQDGRLSQQQNPFAVYERLITQADALAYLPFPDGTIGDDIAGEVEALRTAKPDAKLYEIDLQKSQIREVNALEPRDILGPNQTRQRNRDTS